MALYKKQVVLASTSPRRRELIEIVCDNVVLAASNAEEVLPCEMAPADAARYLAGLKAESVFHERGCKDIVIGCDTIVDLNGQILGKAPDVQGALDMLSSLSGNTHMVHSGVCIISPEKLVEFTATSRVTFKTMTKEEMMEIIVKDRVLDKSGSYAIQGVASMFVEKIEGEFYNIVGLPVAKLYEALKTF